MGNNLRKGIKKRSSIITIGIVLILIIFMAIIVINILENNKEKLEKDNKKYVSNLDEEDKMQYEYSKINKKLDGMYAFAILNDYVVGVQGKDKYVNIIQIDENKDYDYLYFKSSLYLLEKEIGIITVVDLNNIGEIKETINIEDNVKSFEIYNNSIYYISNDNKLIKFENDEKKEILSNITANNFVIKKDYIYIVKDKKLIKLDMNNNETLISENVEELYYYNYYERDRLIYDTTSDSENIFKNIYNYYTGDVINSIRNNTYFLPYDAAEYIYTTTDNKNIVLIKRNGVNEYIYKSDSIIENVNLFKEGYIIAKENDKNIVIDLDTNKEVENDNIINLYNIKYLK